MFPIVQMSRPKHDEVSGLSGLVSCACRTLDGGDRKPVRVTPVVVGEGGEGGGVSGGVTPSPSILVTRTAWGGPLVRIRHAPKVGGLGCVPGPQVVPRPGSYWS